MIESSHKLANDDHSKGQFHHTNIWSNDSMNFLVHLFYSNIQGLESSNNFMKQRGSSIICWWGTVGCWVKWHPFFFPIPAQVFYLCTTSQNLCKMSMLQTYLDMGVSHTLVYSSKEKIHFQILHSFPGQIAFKFCFYFILRIENINKIY